MKLIYGSYSVEYFDFNESLAAIDKTVADVEDVQFSLSYGSEVVFYKSILGGGLQLSQDSQYFFEVLESDFGEGKLQLLDVDVSVKVKLLTDNGYRVATPEQSKIEINEC